MPYNFCYNCHATRKESNCKNNDKNNMGTLKRKGHGKGVAFSVKEKNHE